MIYTINSIICFYMYMSICLFYGLHTNSREIAVNGPMERQMPVYSRLSLFWGWANGGSMRDNGANGTILSAAKLCEWVQAQPAFYFLLDILSEL